MPSRLDLSQPTHGKVMMAPPRINLRRAASYNNHEKFTGAPLSSSSSRFNFNHLLFASPPPSPSLPALVPRRSRSTSQTLLASRPSRILKGIFYCCGIFLTLYLVKYALRHRDAIPDMMPFFGDEEQYEMVGHDTVPGFPTPIVVSGSGKKSRWTVSIPRNYDFPLSLEEYSGMNGRCREVSARARDLHHKTPLAEQTWLAYDSPDDYFIDVDEAEKAGLLANAPSGPPPKHAGSFVGLSSDSYTGKSFCKTSLTYLLESTDAGLGPAVLQLWTLYALAKEQGRAFFIDDTRWAYGPYTDIFKAPPVPDCRPPPRHHMLPCPAQAKHLVVSASTAKDLLPALLAKHQRHSRTDLGAHDLHSLAYTGYKALFGLSGEDETYVEGRIGDIKAKAQTAKLSSSKDMPIIGLHIRHGDRHPFEYQYQETYIPPEVFLGHAERLTEAEYSRSGAKSDVYRAVMVLASDDPVVREEAAFSNALTAQEKISLATKETIEGSRRDPHYLHSFAEEAFGWEGGFFAPMFWNLGGKRKDNNADQAEAQASSDQALKLRSLVGRAYMMDLAVLAGASDKVVCAVSATGCRLLGVMMGWDRGIKGGDWTNVDGDYGWRGLLW